MPRRRALQEIPNEFFSVLGPIPVEQKSDLLEKDECYGAFGPSQRKILLDTSDGSTREHIWQSLWHEVTHLGIWDAGAHEGLTHDQEERICNAMGTYLAAMMAAGYLKVTTPRTK
jgi:hypothetical protein